MDCRSCLVLLLLLSLPFSACRPGDSTPEPPEIEQDTPAEAAVTTDDVAGTYRLVAINDEPLPARAGAVDECEVQLTEGRLALGSDARYDLDVLARAVCDPEEDDEAQFMDRATSEGPYTVEGFEVRFGPAVTRTDQEAWEGRLSEDLVGEQGLQDRSRDDPETPELYDATQFGGFGVLRDSLLVVRLGDDLTTLSFMKE